MIMGSVFSVPKSNVLNGIQELLQLLLFLLVVRVETSVKWLRNKWLLTFLLLLNLYVYIYISLFVHV